MNCAICGQPADDVAYSYTHGCGHTTHTECSEEGFSHKKCKETCGANAPIKQPRPADGIDYVLKPNGKTKASYVGKVIGSLISRKPAEKTPLDLLKEQVSVSTLIKRHNLGLQHILKEGIDIEDFISNGYTWDQLCEFEDISQKGPKRALQAFCTGLGVSANHLRDFGDKHGILPVDKFKKITDIVTSDYRDYLGLEFAPLLRCLKDSNWTAKHCLDIGLKFDDLCDLGMESMYQYKALVHDLSPKEKALVEKRLEVNKKVLTAWMKEEEKYVEEEKYDEEEEYVEEEEDEPVKIMKSRMRVPTSQPQVATPKNSFAYHKKINKK